MDKLFEDLTVVELCPNNISAVVGMLFADFGAQVVMVEPPGGSSLRGLAAFPMWARGKESLMLDAKEPGDLEAIRSLIAGADIVIETFRPGVADRLGLGYQASKALNPRLIHLSVTGFGDRSPYANLKAYEAVVQAKIGSFKMSESMTRRAGPAFVSAPYCSTTVTQVAVHGVLAALVERLKSGEGQHVTTNMAIAMGAHDTWNGMVSHVAKQYPEAFQSGPPVDEDGVPVHGILFRLMTSVSADGRWLQFSQTAQRLFEAFMHELGLDWMMSDPEWKTVPDFDEPWRRREFWEILIERVRSKSLAEWNAVFDANPDVWAEVFRHGPEVMEHPQLVHDGKIVEIVDPERGRVRQLARLATLSEEPDMGLRPAPTLDQHAGEVRSRPSARGTGSTGGTGDEQEEARRSAPPLEGLLVVELATQYAAPFGATILAELGARVVKVEQQDGDQIRWMTAFPELGGVKVLQGKESLAVDIRHPDGLAVVHDLVEKADVVLQAFRAGVAERRGLGLDTLRALNPDLIYVNAPAYGEDGPCGHRPAYAPTIGAACGMAWRNLGGSVPEGPGLDLATVEASSMHVRAATMGAAHADGFSALGAGTALLLGIYARERGLGARHVNSSMLLSTAHALSDGIVEWEGRPETPVADDQLLGFNALYRLYQAASGWVLLAAPDPREWPVLMGGLKGLSSLGSDRRFTTEEGRRANDTALAGELAAVLATRPAQEWEDHFLPLDIACVKVAEVPTYECIYGDELGRPSGYVVDVTHPLFGEHPRSAPLTSYSRSETRAGRGCLLGEQTDAILAELGRSPEEIIRLKEAGVVS